MILLPQYHNKLIAVLGLGKSGFATVASLHASGAKVLAWDDKAAPEELPIALTPPEQWDWENLVAVVISPGVPLTHPSPHPAVTLANQHGVPITSDITLLMEACAQARFIGITGTNGKSTTTALIAHCLRELGANVACGGNIGVPALEMQELGEDGIYVLELSSYQLDSMDAGVLDIACLLNITPDHLDRHGSMEGYIAAKKKIFRGQHPAVHHAVIAVDDEVTHHIAHHLPNAITVSTTVQHKVDWCMDGMTLLDKRQGEEAGYDMSVIASLTGVHNHQNALVAMAACVAAGYAPASIYEAMRSFAGLAHRMERVRVVDGVLCVNDSKATNADAAAKSLAAYSNIYWILGGVAKAGGITTLAALFPHVTKAYCIGEASDAFADTLNQHKVAFQLSGTLEQAVADAFADARGVQDAVMLLAPAAASFDQFANFEARGDAFKALVNKL